MSLPRYAEYKESSVDWFRRIPRHWQEAKFRHVFDESGERIETDVVGVMLSVSGYRGVEVKEYDDENRRRSDEDLVGYRIVRPGQLVVNTMWLNYAGLGVSDHEGHVSPAYRAYWISDDFNKRFVHHMMRSELFVRGYTKYLTGVRPNSLQMSREDLMQFPVLKPPYDEQLAIADFLDRETAKIDTLIAEQERLLELLAEKRQVVISHAVTKGLDPNAPMKDSGVAWLGEVPAQWEVRPLKKCVAYQEGPGIMAADFRDEGVPLLRISCVQSEMVTLDGCNYLDPEMVANQWSHFRVEIGDLLISGSASMGVVSEVGEEAAGAVPYTGLIRLKGLRGGMLKEFIRHLVVSDSFMRQVQLLKTGSTIQHFGPTHLDQMLVVLPPEDDQREIAEFLSREVERINALCSEAKAGMALLRERRSALIAAAVTGQIDVREVA